MLTFGARKGKFRIKAQVSHSWVLSLNIPQNFCLEFCQIGGRVFYHQSISDSCQLIFILSKASTNSDIFVLCIEVQRRETRKLGISELPHHLRSGGFNYNITKLFMTHIQLLWT